MIDALPSDHRHGHPPTQLLKASELVPSLIAAGTTMSTPLSTVHNQIRKRIGPKQFPNDGDPILDEQGITILWRTPEIPSSYWIRVLQNRMNLSKIFDTRW
jgi:hypothetical protein